MKKIASAIILILMVFTACQKSEDGPAKKSAETKSTIEINSPWIRAAAKNMNTALFFEIANNTENEIALVKVESEISKVVEVHETFEKGEDMMGMRQVDEVTIPANGSRLFKPMSFHVMLIGLNQDVKEGETYSANLFFDNGSQIAISAPVKVFEMKK
ncbi:MAG: copper chaperone PCu(A)C [Melioribacteraceae bacterium]|nr:copper chaperone PCu(A)C [Melioribacteraceae bacterium]MCF8263104.1 copper chaperone PCu(A)C [Melioribacteraceae bacterium]MCF8430564.1 copper chaperone PCu(A)C [Melioribacteraceae bacterium]